MELVYTLDLGSSASACEFESRDGYMFKKKQDKDPYRQDVRILAARLQVTCNKKLKRETEPWVVELAGQELSEEGKRQEALGALIGKAMVESIGTGIDAPKMGNNLMKIFRRNK